VLLYTQIHITRTFCGNITKRHQEMSFLRFVCNKGKVLSYRSDFYLTETENRDKFMWSNVRTIWIIRILKLLSGYEWLHVNGSLLIEKHMRTGWIFNLKLKSSSSPCP